MPVSTCRNVNAFRRLQASRADQISEIGEISDPAPDSLFSHVAGQEKITDFTDSIDVARGQRSSMQGHVCSPMHQGNSEGGSWALSGRARAFATHDSVIGG